MGKLCGEPAGERDHGMFKQWKRHSMAEKEGEQTWVKSGEWTPATSRRALSVMHSEHVFGGELGTSIAITIIDSANS